MTSTPGDDWSPADHPYAIAVSEAQWAAADALLSLHRMRTEDQHVGWFSSQQIDARHLVSALRQLLTAENLEQIALKELGIDSAVGEALGEARVRYEQALPGFKDVRNGLTHFDQWARGQGRGPQEKRRNAGELPREVARAFWGFGYDPTKGTITSGPHEIHIDTAERAVQELRDAIYTAAREVDKNNTAALRARTVEALTYGGISCDADGSAVLISPGNDARIWVSLTASAADERARRETAQQAVAALEGRGLRLTPLMAAIEATPVERLARGEPLYVEADPPH